MKPNTITQGKLATLNDIISPTSNSESQVVKITRKIVTTQPVTQTYISKKVVKTTTVGQPPIQNTRYNNTGSSNIQNTTKIKTTSYTRPGVQTTSTSYNRTNYNSNNRNINTNNQPIRNYQKPTNQINQPQRIQNSSSYSGSLNQPRRPDVSSSHYKPRFNSPNPGSEKRKTIYRGQPIQNVQITHIIYSKQPLEFHITEDLNKDNLNTSPIHISREKNKNSAKEKVKVTCSCDNVKIKNPKKADLSGIITHYQHAQGIGMTDDRKENMNPQFYTSEIKALKPIIFKRKEPLIEILEFRSTDRGYNTARPSNKTSNKPMIVSATRRNNNTISTPSKNYNNNSTQLKNYSSVNNNKGGYSGVKSVTNTGSNYKGGSYTGKGSQITKETTTQVKMGNRSQYQNPSKPIVTTSIERKVYNSNTFSKK